MTRFKRYSGQRYFGWIRDDFMPSPILDRPEDINQDSGAEHLLDCEGRQIHRLQLRIGDRMGSCFTYYFTNGSVSRAFRKCPAFRILRYSQLLHRAGFATIEVLAALRRKAELLSWTSLVVAREIPSVFEIPSRGSHVFQIHRFLDFGEDWPVALGRYLARFHDAGFLHGDLKTRHILVQPSSGDFEFYLVDLEKCLYLPHCPEPVRAVLVARDLIQLFVSLQESTDGKIAAGDLILDSYTRTTGRSARFKERVHRIVRLYSADGSFQQGRTVAENLWDLLIRRGSSVR